MTDFSVTLTIPEYLYAQARRLAEQKAQPIEQILLRQLELTFVDLPPLPPDQQTELEALTHLSDPALWTIAREQMPDESQQRMQILMERNNLGTISAPDRDELTALVEQGKRLILRKAKAMALLKGHGHSLDLEEPL